MGKEPLKAGRLNVVVQSAGPPLGAFCCDTTGKFTSRGKQRNYFLRLNFMDPDFKYLNTLFGCLAWAKHSISKWESKVKCYFPSSSATMVAQSRDTPPWGHNPHYTRYETFETLKLADFVNQNL